MKGIDIIIAESSDIMLNGITALLNGRPEINITRKVSGLGSLSELLISSPEEIVLIGPILSEKYPREIRDGIRADFPSVKVVEIDLKDEQNSIIQKIIRASKS